MNGRDYNIKLNAFEAGVLQALIMASDDRKQQALRPVWEQLLALKKQIEEEAGVQKEMIPGGKLKITDSYGNIIIREPFPWELIEVNVSVSLDLGTRLVQVGDKVLGSCDGIMITVSEATPEELIQLKNAQVIKLVQPLRG